jgi:hypothetical protein
MEEGETLEHFHHRFSDYLGVSVKIMKTVYNRSHLTTLLLSLSSVKSLSL